MSNHFLKFVKNRNFSIENPTISGGASSKQESLAYSVHAVFLSFHNILDPEVIEFFLFLGIPNIVK